MDEFCIINLQGLLTACSNNFRSSISSLDYFKDPTVDHDRLDQSIILAPSIRSPLR